MCRERVKLTRLNEDQIINIVGPEVDKQLLAQMLTHTLTKKQKPQGNNNDLKYTKIIMLL